MINTLLFDLDGTLIDTSELIISSFKYTFKKYFPSKRLTKEELISFMGPSIYDTFSKYEKDLDKIEEMVLTYRKHNIENHDLLAKTFDDVKETIAYLYAHHINLGIVSTKSLNVIIMGLKLAGIDAYFTNIISFNDVKKVKPDPEGIFLALEKWDDVDEALIIGDNISDLLAGRNANIKTCAVNWSLKALELREFNPDYYIYSIKDLLGVVNCLK